MELNPKQRQMLMLANECWERFQLQSRQNLVNWQDRHYIPGKDLIELEERNDRNRDEETRLAYHGLAASFQLIHSLLGDAAAGLQKARENLATREGTTVEGLQFEAVSIMAPIAMFIPRALVHAFNPTGRPENMNEAYTLAERARLDLLKKSKDFPVKDAANYADFACKVLAEHLPKEYSRLLAFEMQTQREKPSSEIDASQIDPATRSVIQKISSGQGRASGE